MKPFTFIFFLFITLYAFSQKEIKLTSPDRNIVFTFKLVDSAPLYKISYKVKLLLNYSSLQFDFAEGGRFAKSVKMGNVVIRDSTESYALVVGKAKKVISHYRQIVIPLGERSGLKSKINLNV